jgi:chemotaxis protein MotB
MIKTGFFQMLMMLMVVASLGSCVAKKKFIASEDGRLSAEEQVRVLTANVNAQNQKISELESTIFALNKRIAGLESDTTRLGNQNRDFQKILSSTMTQQEQLNAMLRSQQDALAERERTINELNSIIQAQKDLVSNLLRQVTNALTGFSSDELTVEMRDGKVYVAMSDRLLFRSGSADVDNRGKQALALLADVLTKQPEIDIFIEGHTDNVPIRTARFTDNWDLSVIRSTSVVRILTAEYHVNTSQIIPSGRSQYFPVDDNTTPEGRARNRRTEIILSPKLDKLFQMLDDYQAN